MPRRGAGAVPALCCLPVVGHPQGHDGRPGAVPLRLLPDCHGSGRNYDTIMGTLEMIPTGQLNGFPFKLRLVEGQTSYFDENGQRRTTTRHFLELEPDPTIVRMLYKRQTERMLGAPVETELLEAGPDWGEYDPNMDADPVAPPPRAEVQQPDEPVEAVVVEQSSEPVVIQVEPVQPPADLTLVPPPADLDRGNLLVQAIGLPGYGNLGAVKTAMLALYGPGWEKDDWTAAGAWQQLQEHKA